MKKAIIVGVNVNNEEYFEESFKELKGLAKACDLKVVGSLTQNLKAINKKTYIGQGKIDSLKIFALEHEADIIIFNNELSPLQYKNLEEALQIEVIDRTLLILNIFASRARSKEAKLQVEVARLNYLLPRLVLSDENYEQQGGGSLHNRGSGEKQIDIDKRRPVLANNTGGYSGPGIRSVGVRAVYQMAQAVKIPVIEPNTNAGKNKLRK